ncbi:MAG: toprim domain-containing protein [Methanomassiliicoccaceae archaeon]|nr:toprim domain-containing protein [Methanomassiliicoccaceae archaeon]
MNNEERLERLNVILDELTEMCGESVLLVEGMKDKMAVVLLGVNAEMRTVQSEGGPLKVAERLFDERRSAVILTDWDPKGEQIAEELERALSSLCVKYDTSMRSRLRSLCGSEINDVESLPSFYSRLATESVRRKVGRK